MPKVRPDRSDVMKFDKDQLKHVETSEKVAWPKRLVSLNFASNIPCLSKYFILLNRHVSINYLAIQDEMVDSRAEVKSFDKSNLKNVNTQEKNTLPNAGSKSAHEYI